MKIIFLDVDGVLNSYRNIIAYGAYPFPGHHDGKHKESLLDPLAVGMIRKLCEEFDAKIVLHSTWRAHTDPIGFGKRWFLPIIDGTNPNIGKPASIKEWLSRHPEVKNYIVIDDDDMEVGGRQVATDPMNGFIMKDYSRCQKKLAQFAGLGAGLEK